MSNYQIQDQIGIFDSIYSLVFNKLSFLINTSLFDLIDGLVKWQNNKLHIIRLKRVKSQNSGESFELGQ